jgi:hypothetical protein
MKITKCVYFAGYNSEPFNQLEKWLKSKPSITVVSHSHILTPTGLQQLIVIYTEPEPPETITL